MSAVLPGLKLSYDWRARREWAQSIQDFEQVFDQLRRMGVGHAEFSLWNRRTAAILSPGDEAEQVMREAACLIERGATVYLHPYVHQDERGPGHFGGPNHDRVVHHLNLAIETGARIAEVQGSPCLLVFHAADQLADDSDRMHGSEYRQTLIRNTRAFFQHAEARVRLSGAYVDAVCENPPPNPQRVRIGEYPDELLQVVAGTSVGLCWDFGHYWMCAARYGYPNLPGPKFNSLVRHAHLHSVSDDGRDHRIPSLDDDYLQRCLSSLAAWQRDIVVTLEYDYTGQGSTGSAIDAVRRGVDVVAAAT